VTNAAAAGDGDGNGGDDKTGKKQQNWFSTNLEEKLK
jgi:hypothetical protein